MKMQIKRLNPRAILPTYGTSAAAGADLYALLPEGETMTVLPGETAMCHTGLAMAIPQGFAGLVFARSGLSVKQGLAPANKVGVIDADYRGELMVALYNQSKEPRTVCHGDRIAQLVVVPVAQPASEESGDPPETLRGEGGFGSTGR